MIRDDTTGELVTPPSESVRRTDWGYQSSAAVAIAAGQDETSMKAAKTAVELATPASPSVPFFSVAHIPWAVGGLAIILIGSLVGLFIDVPWLLIATVVAGLLLTFLGPALISHQVRGSARVLSVDDPVFETSALVRGRARRLANPLLRAYARDEIPVSEADDLMDLILECSVVADRLQARGLDDEVDALVDAADPSEQSLRELLADLQVMEMEMGERS